MCPLLIQVCFCSEIIYFVPVQVQFILNELYFSYFLTPDILVITLKIMKKIRLSQNSMKFFLVIRFREMNPTVKYVSSSGIYKKFQASLNHFGNLTVLSFFRKIKFFPGFTLFINIKSRYLKEQIHCDTW